jgi:hypothetical protein
LYLLHVQSHTIHSHNLLFEPMMSQIIFYVRPRMQNKNKNRNIIDHHSKEKRILYIVIVIEGKITTIFILRV